ncbi:superinfection exclusion B family protein [Shewanella nanhaiensis]|uniref:Superinfection exclusion B family protein n=1 Tax=Shewanella nanhaiensis TaxID=2864872 RepID=A0ABS7DYT7_9GAMM|nr:superinfection exclusion B family protein [Shewanella nanhaiensis]MBW8182598.1 superinfection exclusion B family protein [Shewanella nanhaiensis]
MQVLKSKNVKQLSSKQLSFNLMLWLAIVSGALLFMPESLLQMLNLDTAVTANAHFIGLGLIIGVAYLLTQVLNYFLDEAITYLKGKRIIEVIEEKVRLLDPAERALLREFFLQGETILTLPQGEPAVKSLLAANIIESLGNQKHYAIQGPTADYKISMRARTYLNRQVLRLPVGEPSQEEMQNLIKARPTFANNMVSPRKHAA